MLFPYQSKNTYLDLAEDQEKKLDQIIDALPHGSGFDAKWELNQILKNGKWEMISGFHNMNENGYYDGWTDIRITFYPENPSDFRLFLSGKKRYTDYNSRDYLRETIHYALSQMVG